MTADKLVATRPDGDSGKAFMQAMYKLLDEERWGLFMVQQMPDGPAYIWVHDRLDDYLNSFKAKVQ